MPIISEELSRREGMPPGALIFTGEKLMDKSLICVTNYDEKVQDIRQTEKIEEALTFINKSNLTWINIVGLQNVEIIEKIGDFFKLHPLMLEDILETEQRPKIETFGDYVLILIKRVFLIEEKNELKDVQISIILGSNFVITFQEQVDDVFNPIIERISKGKGRIRKMGADYLIFALLDVIVDIYFTIIERISRKLEILEDQLLSNPTQDVTNTVHKFKRQILFLHKSVWPMREILNNLERAESPFISSSTVVYFKDIQNHIIQIIDTIDLFREMVSNMFEIYLSSVSNKLNEIMKVLAIISTVFIPLSFIASFYGMNFHYMPELNWQWAYYTVIIAMISVFLVMIFFFKKKKWM